jgi:exosortase
VPKLKKTHLAFHMLNSSNLNLGLKVATIIASTLAIFHQDLAIIINDALKNEATSYVLTIPFLFIYLIYRKRKMLRQLIPLENKEQPKKTRHLPTIMGILLSITAILLYWQGSYTFTPLEYHMLTLPIFTAGLILILFNIQTLRQLAFPIVFLILLTPPPSMILYSLGSSLSVISSQASYAIVKALNIPATLLSEYGNPIIQITTQNQTTLSFAVDIACSGIYSLIGFLIFAVFFTYIIRDKPWKKLALFLTGFSLIYLLNIIRITTIITIGFYSNEETALQLFHLLGGWFLILMGTLLLLLIAEKIFRTQFFTKPVQKCEECNPKPKTKHNFCFTCARILKPASIRLQKTDIIKMTTILVSVILLISIQSPVFALTEGPAQVIIQTPAGQKGNTQLLPQIEGYALSFVYRDTEFEELSRQDASLLYAYYPLDKTKDPVWVGVEIGTSTSLLHSWEKCLISWRIEHDKTAIVRELDLKDIQLQENPPIISRYFAFQWVETNQTQVVLYWFGTARFITNGTDQQKNIKISLITYPDTPQNLMEAENLLRSFAPAIVEYWQPIKTWTQTSLVISQNGAYLAAITAVFLAVLIVLYLIEKIKQMKANTNAYTKLSKPTKQLIDIVIKTQKTTTPTLSAIAATSKNETGESIEKEELFHRISEAEKTGIIKSHIASNQDEPIQIWKAQMLS